MFAQVGVDAPRELAGGALLCEVSTLVRSPAFLQTGRRDFLCRWSRGGGRWVPGA